MSMKKKKILTLIVLFGLFCVFGSAVYSCQERDSIDNHEGYKNFRSNFYKSYSLFTATDITPKALTRTTDGGWDNLDSIYIDLPEGSDTEDVDSIGSIECFEDVVDVMCKTGATLSEYRSETTDTSFVVSEEKVSQALTPLISDCKEYLYSKGLTDADIQEMLLENNCEESSLIPFVLVLTNWEAEDLYGNVVHTNWFFSKMIATTAYADGVDLYKLGGCVAEALGADLLFSLAQSAGKSWAKAALKKTFKFVAKRMFGPVGAAIAIIEFSHCMF